MFKRIGLVFQPGSRASVRLARAVTGLLSVALGFALLGSAAYWTTSGPAAPTAYAEGTGSVSGITSTCPVDTISGVVTVQGPIAAGTITLEAFANTPGSGSDNFGSATGAVDVVDVGPLSGGEAQYAYSLTIPAQFLGSPYNSLRVQITQSSISGLNGMTTKGPSLTCGGAEPTPTPTPTSTPIPPPSVVQIDFVCEGANGQVCVDVQLTSAPATPITATLDLYENGGDVATTTISLTGTDNRICLDVGGVFGQSYQVKLSSPSGPLSGKTVSDTHTLGAGCVAPTPTPTPTPTNTPTPTPTPTPTDTPTPTPTPTDTPTPVPTGSPTPKGAPTPSTTPTAQTTPTDAPAPAATQLAETGGFQSPLLLIGLVILGAGLIVLGTLVLRPRRR